MSSVLQGGKGEFGLGKDSLQLSDFERDLAAKLLRPETIMLFADDRFIGYLAERLILAGLNLPISQVQGFSFVPAKLIDVNVFMTPIEHTNWNSIRTSGTPTPLFGGIMESSGAQNDEIDSDVAMSPGTWTLELMHARVSNNGIYTVYVDGTSVGTIDGYENLGLSAANVNVRSSITGIAVANTQQVRLKLKMETKNASSTSFYGRIQTIQLRKTSE